MYLLDLTSSKFKWVHPMSRQNSCCCYFFWKLIQHPPLLVWGMMYESKLTGMERYVHRKNFGPKIALKNDGGHYWALCWLDSTYMLWSHSNVHFFCFIVFLPFFKKRKSHGSGFCWWWGHLHPFFNHVSLICKLDPRVQMCTLFN